MAGSRTTYRFRWDGNGVVQQMDKAMAAGLKVAGLHARKVMKARLSGAAGSPVGGPPGKVTGTLQRAVASRSFRKKDHYVGVRVGVPAKSPQDAKKPGGGKRFPGVVRAQAVRLAAGYTGTDRAGRTYNQGPRPFAVPVLQTEQGRMASLIKDGARRYAPRPKETR